MSSVGVLDLEDTIVTGVDRRDAFEHQVEVYVARNSAVENRDGLIAAEILQDSYRSVEVEFRVVDQVANVHSVASLISKLCPQADDVVADLPRGQADDLQIVPSVDGCHQDFEELDFEAGGVVLRVFLPELCPVALQVCRGVNPVVVRVDECHGVFLLLDLRACGSG